MAAPTDLVGAEVLDVNNRSRATGLLVDESFNVGPYQVRKVKRGFNTTQSTDVGGLTQEHGHQSFRFQFIGEQIWEGRCERNASETLLKSKRAVFVADSLAQLDCSCTSASQSVRLKLDNNSYPMRGSMVLSGGVQYYLRQAGFAGHVRSGTMGYRVDYADGHAAAAADLDYPGRIWRQPNLPKEQQEPQACLLSALMIHRLQ